MKKITYVACIVLFLFVLFAALQWGNPEITGKATHIFNDTDSISPFGALSDVSGHMVEDSIGAAIGIFDDGSGE